MYFYDNKHHNMPHFHVEYAEFSALVGSSDGVVLAGNLPSGKTPKVLLFFSSVGLLDTIAVGLREKVKS